MVDLYLARHGETEENVAQILQGHLPGHLTENGKAQAEALRECLIAQKLHFDICLASDLKRTLDTAQIINVSFHLTILPCPLLRERDWGSVTGRKIGTICLNPLPQGAESIEDLFQRAHRFLTYIQENYDGKQVLAIGHGLFNRCIQACLNQVTIQDIPKMQNAEIRHLVIDTVPELETAVPASTDQVSAN